jgi:hypothetical protein
MDAYLNFKPLIMMWRSKRVSTEPTCLGTIQENINTMPRISLLSYQRPAAHTASRSPYKTCHKTAKEDAYRLT